MSKSYKCINISYTKIQNKTPTIVVFTVSHTYSRESHLPIQKLYIYIYRSERRTYSDVPLIVCWPSRMRKITVSFFCTFSLLLLLPLLLLPLPLNLYELSCLETKMSYFCLPPHFCLPPLFIVRFSLICLLVLPHSIICTDLYVISTLASNLINL